MKKEPGVSIRASLLAVIVLAPLMALLVSSCSTKAVRPDLSMYAFPPPPDTARIRLVDIYVSSEDLGSSTLALIAGGNTKDRLLRPTGVAFDTSGNLVVADNLSGIVIINRNTHEFNIIRHGSIRSPLGVAVARNNDIYVADGRSASVVVFTQDGIFRRKMGQPGWFENPVGVILDENRDRISVVSQRFRTD